MAPELVALKWLFMVPLALLLLIIASIVHNGPNR